MPIVVVIKLSVRGYYYT